MRRSTMSCTAGVEGPHRAVDIGRGRDHVVDGARMHLRDRNHQIVERVVVARHDGRHGLRDGDGRRDRIGGLVRHGAVPAHARDMHLERVDRRHDRPRRGQDLAHLEPRHVVERIDLPMPNRSMMPLGAHHPRAAAAFLGGLKDQRDLAREIPRLGQVFRSPQQHRGVPVMAAGMHLAGGWRHVQPPSPR
jgi:hypothetical protein